MPLRSAFVGGTSPAPVWYQADGTTVDHDGNGPALSWSGTPGYGPGAFVGEGQSFAFDGTNGLSGGTTLGDLGTDAFYLSFDVHTTSAVQSALVSKRASCSASAYLDLRMTSDGTVLAEYDGGQPAQAQITSTSKVNDGSWHTVGLTQVGSGLSLVIDGVVQDSVTLNVIPDVTSSADFAVGNGDPCIGVDGTRPLAGDIDNVFLTDISKGGEVPADLSASQGAVPSVPAGGGGSFAVNLTNPSSSSVTASYSLAPPPGVSFTAVSGDAGQCSVIAGAVSCNPGGVAGTLTSGTTGITVTFSTSPSDTPGSTLTTTSDALVNRSAPDPDHYNDTTLAVSVDIASAAGVPIASPAVIGGTAAGGALLACGVAFRRRRRSSPTGAGRCSAPG